MLVTGAWNVAKEHIAEIESKGHTVVFMQYEADELPCAYEWVEGTICNGLFLSHPIDKFTNLKYIQLTSAGFDRVPMEYINAHGIEIHNAHGVYSIPMAEFAVSGVLQLYKQARFFQKNQSEHKWEKHRGLLELCGKTVCVVGCGSVGTECAKRFKAFDCTVVGIDLFPRETEYFEKILPFEKVDAVIPKTDIMILTVPLTDKTKHLINEDKLALMKFGAVLVNISRGAVVDENALIEALKTKLRGAVLDVFESEPLMEGSPLWNMDNVILTPHNSFVGDKNGERLSNLININIENYKVKEGKSK